MKLMVFLNFQDNMLHYRLNNGYPPRNSQPISQAIPGLPNNIDAIFQWSGNGKVYAFKGKYLLLQISSCFLKKSCYIYLLFEENLQIFPYF